MQKNLGKDKNQIVILSFAKDKVVINNGILEEDRVKISKRPMPFKFETIYPDEKTVYKEFDYTPNLKRPISIIDPETTEEIKPEIGRAHGLNSSHPTTSRMPSSA